MSAPATPQGPDIRAELQTMSRHLRGALTALDMAIAKTAPPVDQTAR